MLTHKLTGTSKKGNNITLCGVPGAGTTIRGMVTCDRCRRKMHMKLLNKKSFKWNQRPKPRFHGLCDKLEKIRKQYKATSDEGLLLGMFRDITSALKRKADVERYFKEIRELE